MMQENSKIGFTYQDLAIANVINIIFSQSDIPFQTQVVETINVGARAGHVSTVERLAAAHRFVKHRQAAYYALTPVQHIVMQILDNVDYFPENPMDFEMALFGQAEDHTPEQAEILAAHPELLEFWKAYAIHSRATQALVALAAAYGAEHTTVFKDNEYPCLYHRGMTDVDPDVQRIVDVYNHYKEVLGFTPAVLTADHRVFPPVADLLFDVTSDLTVNIPTLGGRIWFDGKPNDEAPGGAKLQEV